MVPSRVLGATSRLKSPDMSPVQTIPPIKQYTEEGSPRSTGFTFYAAPGGFPETAAVLLHTRGPVFGKTQTQQALKGWGLTEARSLRIWAQHAGRVDRLKAEQAAQRAQQRDAHYAATRGITLQMAEGIPRRRSAEDPGQ